MWIHFRNRQKYKRSAQGKRTALTSSKIAVMAVLTTLFWSWSFAKYYG